MHEILLAPMCKNITYVLHVYSMSSLQAMEWLIQHQADKDIDDPIPQPPTSDTHESYPLNDISLSTDVTKETTEDSPGAKIPDEHTSRVNKTKKQAKRRKWEFVPDQLVSKFVLNLSVEELNFVCQRLSYSLVYPYGSTWLKL